MNDTARPRVLMISKPVVPPWDDSARNIVRDQVRFGSNYTYRVLTTKGAEPPGPLGQAVPIYGSRGGHSPSMSQKIAVMAYGLLPRRADIYHYFFAPNPLTAHAGRLQKRLAGVKTVQTICSKPASFEQLGGLLFTDKVVVLSDDTYSKAEAAGIDPGRLHRIRPGIEPIDPLSEDVKRATRAQLGLPEGPLVIYPGDLEFSNAPDVILGALPRLLNAMPTAVFVFACRVKTERALGVQKRLQTAVDSFPWGRRVHFINAVDNMPAFVGSADLVILPSENLYAKMDVPLVLLEAMSAQVPVAVANTPPLAELVNLGAAAPVQPGDSEHLSEVMLQMISDRATADALARAGRQAVLEHFSAQNMAREIENVYHELLER